MSAVLGLSTYAFFWRASDRVPEPLTLRQMLDQTAQAGMDVFQICDYAPLLELSEPQLRDLRARADDLGVALELGTRGTSAQVLAAHLQVAEILQARLVRSMWTAGTDRPDAQQTEARLRAALPDYHRAGVTLALETYEQVPTRDLVAVVEQIGNDHLGICLDPANTVALLEQPDHVVAACVPYVKNWHVKDFAFTRQDGWVGFNLVGAPLGTGLLDLAGIHAALEPAQSGISQIVEHWLPWQGSPEASIRTEADWTETSITMMRSTNRV